MCGIVGIVKDIGNHVTTEEFHDFLTMLVAAEERGNQATGIAYLVENKDPIVLKGPVKASTIAPFIRNFSGLRGIIGHTRLSTAGSPLANKNNHPHEDDNWVLIHNGCVSIDTKLEKELKLSTLCDTEYFVKLFSSIEAKNPDCALQKIFEDSFKELWGSWSLCFVRKETREVLFTSNGGSPFTFFSFDGGMYFGSLENYVLNTTKAKELGVTETKGITDNVVFKYVDGAELSPICVYKEATFTSGYDYRKSGIYSSENFDTYEDHWYNGGYNYRHGNFTQPKNNLDVYEDLDIATIEDLLSYGCTYVVSHDVIEYQFPFEEKDLVAAAKRVLAENQQLFGLSNEEVKHVLHAGYVPKSKIKREFIDIFVSAVESEEKKHNGEDVDLFVLVENGKPIDSVYQAFKWYDRVFAVKYGLFLDGFVVDNELIQYVNYKDETVDVE